MSSQPKLFGVDGFVENEAVESDGEGGEVVADSCEEAEVESEDDSAKSLEDFVVGDEEAVRQQLEAQLRSDDDNESVIGSSDDSDSATELLELEREFGVDSNSTLPNADKSAETSDIDIDAEAMEDWSAAELGSDNDDTELHTTGTVLESESESEMADESADEMGTGKKKSGKRKRKRRGKLSSEQRAELVALASKQLHSTAKTDLESLFSDLSVESLLQLEENRGLRSGRLDPFASQNDLITTTEHSKRAKRQLDVSAFLGSFDGVLSRQSAFLKEEGIVQDSNSGRRVEVPTTILRESSKQQFEFLESKARLDNVALSITKKQPSTAMSSSHLSSAKAADASMSEMQAFANEEKELAKTTAKLGVSMNLNLEKRMEAPPLSTRDARSDESVARKKKGKTAGKEWFEMPRGELSLDNKLHFLMVKYRHLLYRSYKPPKNLDKKIPKYFQMGRVVEGPADYYSARLTKRKRKDTWSHRFMTNATTKMWLRKKTQHALSKQKRSAHRSWKPVRQFKMGEKYKVRKKLAKSRRVRQRKNSKKFTS